MAFRCGIKRARGGVRLSLPRSDVLAVYGAAYAMMPRADAAMDRSGSRIIVWLWPRRPSRPEALARAFASEFENQRVRWAVARRGRALRAETRRLLWDRGFSGPGVRSESAGLTSQQLSEMSRLVTESEHNRSDPLGISVPWDVLRRRRS